MQKVSTTKELTLTTIISDVLQKTGTQNPQTGIVNPKPYSLSETRAHVSVALFVDAVYLNAVDVSFQ